MKPNPLRMVAASLLRSISHPPPPPATSVARLPFALPIFLAGTGLSSKGAWALLTALALALPAWIPTTHAQTAEDFEHTSDGAAITITRYTGPDGDVSIPSTINGLPVTTLGDEAFSRRSGLTSVAIPNSVTTIGNGAFGDCGSLTGIEVDIGNSHYASVQGVLLDKSQTTLIQYPGARAGSYTIPNSVTTIGDWAFSYCTSLTSVTIPNSLTTIGNSAFFGCSGLTSVTIPNSVTTIGDSAFYSCMGLTSVTIPNSVTTIGNRAFYLCSGLSSVYFQGNAPIAGISIFHQTPLDKVYYLPGTLGWGETFAGRPAAVWFLPDPLILTNSPGPGVRNSQFGFTISWATNAAVTVEASADLANPVWTPVATHTLTGGTADFTDPDWAAYPSRFYRLRPAPPQ